MFCKKARNFSFCLDLVLSSAVVELPVFLSEPSAAGSYNWLPAPLGCILTNAGNTKQWRTAVKESSFFFMIISYQSQSRIHKIHNNHGCTITRNWFRRTCKESKITLYYWLHTMIIMQFTGLLSVHFSSFFLCFSFLQKPACFASHENPPNKCAKITR
jgi:hypothetical protein